MAGGGTFRNTNWDPVYIVSQILALQSSFYFFLSICVFIFELFTNSSITLDHVLSYKEIRLDSLHSWFLFLMHLVNAGISTYLQSYIVQRARQCLDFACTLHFIHLISCWIYGGFPRYTMWWLLNISTMLIMAIGGEWLCMRKELRPISLTRNKTEEEEYPMSGLEDAS